MTYQLIRTPNRISANEPAQRPGILEGSAVGVLLGSVAGVDVGGVAGSAGVSKGASLPSSGLM